MGKRPFVMSLPPGSGTRQRETRERTTTGSRRRWRSVRRRWGQESASKIFWWAHGLKYVFLCGWWCISKYNAPGLLWVCIKKGTPQSIPLIATRGLILRTLTHICVKSKRRQFELYGDSYIAHKKLQRNKFSWKRIEQAICVFICDRWILYTFASKGLGYTKTAWEENAGAYVY